MEEKFLEQLKKDVEGSDFGSEEENLQIWYNKEGDCVQFKTMPNVPTMGRRIDEYLTLYISIEDEKPIGFQLKDIGALIEEYDADLIAVQVDYTSKDKSLVSIVGLMLIAFDKIPKSISRRSGYEDAFRTIVREPDNIEIPVG